MNPYRERLEAEGLLEDFERARSVEDVVAMRRILKAAKFGLLEIESILRRNGDIGPVPTDEERRKRFWERVVGRIAIAIVSGVILGGVFVYSSSGVGDGRSSRERSKILMSDYRSPREAYYMPFAWGFVIGAVGGLLGGSLVYDPTSKKT